MQVRCIVKPKDVSIEFEADSVADVLTALRNESGSLRQLWEEFGNPESDLQVVMNVGTTESTPPAPEATTAAEPALINRKRGRPAKNQPAPETATAPPPTPIPAAPTPPVPPLATAPAPVAAAPAPAADDGSIPPFLKRDAAPPPPAPAAPSIILGPKIRAHIEATATDDATKKQYLDWLASPGIGLLIPGVGWEEGMGVLQYTTDAQCGGVAKALGVS